jgi:hypothetical protein
VLHLVLPAPFRQHTRTSNWLVLTLDKLLLPLALLLMWLLCLSVAAASNASVASVGPPSPTPSMELDRQLHAPIGEQQRR